MRKTLIIFICSLFGAYSHAQDSLNADKSYLLGRFNPGNDPRFSKIKTDHSSGAAVNGFLRREAYDAFIKMAAAAQQEGVRMVILSATRNFESQKGIWEDKWNGKTIVEGKNLTSVSDLAERARIILHYSSMPGSSRHHWGTDMDLNNLDNAYFESGDGLKMYQWMQTHAHEYGFCQPYTSKAQGRTGYEEEKWHWSYSPLSRRFLEAYLKNIRYDDFRDFEGSQTAVEIGIIKNYVEGVVCGSDRL